MSTSKPGEGLNYGAPLTVGPFERLTTPQKLTVLEKVAEALLTKSPVPPLQAVTENAIYYAFRFLHELFDCLVQGEDIWGQMVLDSLGRTGLPRPAERSRSSSNDSDNNDDDDVEEEEVEEEEEYRDPYIGCLDREKWENAIEELADRILWDRDFELEDHVGGPIALEMMASAHIQQNYFSRRRVNPRRGAAARLEALVLPFCTLSSGWPF
jgi:hypothetical protein